MKNIILVLFILLQILNADLSCGQNQSYIDSLMNVLKTAKEDTNKVELIISIAMYNIDSESQKFLKYAYQSLALSEKLKFDKGKIQSLNAISAYHNYGGRYDSALYYLNITKELIEKSGNKKWLMTLLANMGNNYDSKGDLAKGAAYQLKALKLSEELKDTFAIAQLTGNIAINYELQNDYISAVTFNLKSLKLKEAIYDSAGIARTCLSIGNVYTYLKDYKNALHYLFRALKICEAINDVHDASSCNLSIGIVYNEQENPGEALKYFSKALVQGIEVKDVWLEGNVYSCFGRAFTETGNLDSALFFHTKSLKIMNETGDKVREAEQNEAIGKIYYKKKNYPAAIDFLQKGLALALETGTKGLAEFYKALADVYAEMKNYKPALENYLLYTHLNDSINNIEIEKKIAELQGKYNVDKKEKEIALLNANSLIKDSEIKKQTLLKNFFIAGFALLVLLLFFVYNTVRTRQKLKLQTLRNKIASDLHDEVGSTLSSIAIFSEVAQQQSKEVIPMLNTIGESSHKMLEAMADIVWTINPDNDNFEKIILRMRSFAFELLGAKKIDFDFKTDPSISELKLNMEARKNLYLIFKEAINNMVKYSEANRASFSITGSQNNLTMIIRDNGKGFDTEKLTNGNGIKNMKKRAIEIGAKLLIESEPGTGTTLQLLLQKI